MIRKFTIYAAAVLTIVSICILLITTTALANPHEGSFNKTTDACAGCHRTHAGAPGAKLVNVSSQLDLCTTCHGGSGAQTNVVLGVYVSGGQGTPGDGLRGGGFSEALMDTNANGTTNDDATAVTSKHTIGSGQPITWGSGDPSASPYAGEAIIASLQCGNCHNPHGNGSYRILKSYPTINDDVADNVTLPYAADDYTITYDGNNYRDMSAYTPSVVSLMSEWCGQCHTRYHADPGSGSSPIGDALFIYRHETEGLAGECLSCHVAHGTSATMNGYAESSDLITWPDEVDATWQDTGENDYSRLLTVNNRGVCVPCHLDIDQN